MKLSIKDLVTITEKILNGNFIFCAVKFVHAFGDISESKVQSQSSSKNTCRYVLRFLVLKLPDDFLMFSGSKESVHWERMG